MGAATGHRHVPTVRHVASRVDRTLLEPAHSLYRVCARGRQSDADADGERAWHAYLATSCSPGHLPCRQRLWPPITLHACRHNALIRPLSHLTHISHLANTDRPQGW